MGDTLVVSIEPYKQRWLVTAGGIFVGVPVAMAVGYGVMRRRKRDEEDAVDEFFRYDDSGTTEDEHEEPPMPELDSNSQQFEELCDQLFHAYERADFWDEPLDSRHLAPRDELDRRLDATHGSSTATPLHNAAQGRAERHQPRSAALGIEQEHRMNPEGVRQTAANETAGVATITAQPRRCMVRPTSRKNAENAKDAETKAKLSRRFKGFTALSVFVWLSVFGFCLHKGLTPHIDMMSIRDMTVGTIVPPDKIHGDGDLLYGEKVNPKTWRYLFVEGKKNDGSRWDADLLVPLWWIEEQSASRLATVISPVVALIANASPVQFAPVLPAVIS